MPAVNGRWRIQQTTPSYKDAIEWKAVGLRASIVEFSLLFSAGTIHSITELNSLVVERSEHELDIQLCSVSSLSSCPQTRARCIDY